MARLTLDVPHYYQERGTNLCSLWCLKMVYEYYGLHREVPDLLAEVQRIPTGVYIQEIARHALGNGFAVELWTRDTTRLPVAYERLSQEEVMADLRQRLVEEELGEKQRAYLEGLLGFLEQGGRLRVGVPTLADPIERDLAAGHPLICSLDLKALYGSRGLDVGWPPAHRLGQVGHYVVVSGLDDDAVTVNDPAPYPGGLVAYPPAQFLYSLYSYQGYVLSLRPAEGAEG
ncbi:MAG: hypothetical protein M1401_01305 [Chloroflexi bacterium]|nr:hypothetical protein [Chloroflexota bacterium]MCL5107515.1 hypothetical protein [Chloroflexota bacterium]